MLSFDHQARVELVRDHLELAPLLIERLGVDLPPYETIHLADATFARLVPTEYHADALPVLESKPDAPRLGIIVEVQLNRDPAKKKVWPVYEALTFTEYGEALLLVITADEATADWAAEPIRKSRNGSVTVPLVLRPKDVPRIVSIAQAREQPALAVFSAVTHAAEPESAPVVLAGLAALQTSAFSGESSRFYSDYIRSKMNEASAKALEAMMPIEGYEYQTEFSRRYVAQGEAKGRAEGKAESLLEVLRARGLKVSASQAERIRACTDEAQLSTWLVRALKAKTTKDVLE